MVHRDSAMYDFGALIWGWFQRCMLYTVRPQVTLYEKHTPNEIYR
ncbi:hypothetical protein MAQ5080_03179 [Marinomonas aquimarina]|uniref:Uncharacterized protein n=1 Tax=Marinomonas aquimarina TaxID=295068 RepID=A0A1A8TQP0_9GAMM|nr:hypothetical protein MAQ5080_03179 [Marinomonas aquimarina]